MSKWNHSICERCWVDQEGDWEPQGVNEFGQEEYALRSVRKPARVDDAALASCCFCSAPTISGIFVRRDPDDVPYCDHAETVDA